MPRSATADTHTAELLARASGLFARAFGRTPTHAARAPGRVNLIGEHTDYNLGHVLPIAIDRCTVAVGAACDGPSAVVSEQAGGGPAWTDLGSLRPGALPAGHWSRYALGPLAVLAQGPGAGRGRGLLAAVASSVPVGGGLSSSASLEVALLTLASAAWALEIDGLTTALLAQRAEHEHAGVPCGLMDQLAAVYGREDAAMLIDCRTNRVEHVALPDAGRAAVVVTDSLVRHALASGGYAERRASCARVAAALGVDALADATPWALRRLEPELAPDDASRARHVIGENQRVLACAGALRAGDLALAGQLMLASHESLRRDFTVSTPELDALVEASLEVPGVYGSRLTGGGFGGCMVTLCDPRALGPLGERLANVTRTWPTGEVHSYAVRACPGAGRLDV
jgi:galactokinase